MLRKAIISLATILATTTIAFTLNYQAGMGDRDRIAITPLISESDDITGQARNLLQARMSNIINLNGLAAQEKASYFAMVPQISVVSEDITSTAPPMHALTLYVSFTIVDNYSGAVFGETNLEVRGVDQSRERAFTHAIRSINPRAGQFRVMMERAKDQILAFYDTECELVIATAQSLVEQGKKREAIEVLTSIPSVSRECHDRCMILAGEIGPVPEPVTAQRQREDSPQQEESFVDGMKGRLRDLKVEIVNVEYTGVGIDITILLINEVENTRVNLRRMRFIDREGNEFRRNPYLRVDLVRGVHARRTLTYRDDNIDLVTFLRVLEFEFSGLGTLRFDNIEVKR